jgi:hypothetical protein
MDPPARGKAYPKTRKSRTDSAWRRGLAAFAALLERQGFVVEVVADVMDQTGAYIEIAPNIIVQVAWDRSDVAGIDEPATYGATLETEDEVRHLGYTRSPEDLIAIVAELRPESPS